MWRRTCETLDAKASRLEGATRAQKKTGPTLFRQGVHPRNLLVCCDIIALWTLRLGDLGVFALKFLTSFTGIRTLD